MDAQYDSATSDVPLQQSGIRFSWTIFLLVAVIIYELTSHVWLGVTFLCTKFGWEYFRTAIWLKRSDPDRTRGHICLWIYLAAGMWRTAVAGVALMFAYALVHGDNKNQGPPPEFVEAVLVAVVGFCLSASATLFGMGLARWRGRRVWLDSGVHRNRQRNIWPPTMTGPNQAGPLILTSIFVFAVPCAGLGLVLLILAANQIGLVHPTALIVVFMSGIGLLSFAILGSRDFLQRRILASEFENYWNAIPSTISSIKK